MTIVQLDRGVAEACAVPGTEAAQRHWVPTATADLLTPTADIALQVAHLPHVVQVIESYQEGLCVVVVVVTRTDREAVEPLYRAELATAAKFPRARFVLRTCRSGAILDPTAVPGATRSFAAA